MNAMYVTVSIPFLLVLAGFNHAYGLTTFGKSQGPPQPPQQPPAQMKQCNNQSVCNPIKGTTCIQGHCLCGDNHHPVNGACTAAVLKGPQHLCAEDAECVNNADCLPIKEVKPKAVGFSANDKICQCKEGFAELNNLICGGGTHLTSLTPALIIMVAVLTKTLN